MIFRRILRDGGAKRIVWLNNMSNSSICPVPRFSTPTFYFCRRIQISHLQKNDKAMEKQQLNDYLQSKQLRTEAFKELSGSYPLTEEMMLAFQNELDWTRVSANNNISWWAEKIERWKDHIDWKVFSRNVSTNILTPNNIERFKDYWDWGMLSGRYC